MTTTEERISVLRALAKGAISVQEADDRLLAFDGGDGSRADGRRRGRRTVDDAIALAAHGVEADFLHALHDAGFADLDTAEIIRLADHGVETDWLVALPASVAGELDVDDLVALVDHGVEAEDLEAFLDVRRSRHGA